MMEYKPQEFIRGGGQVDIVMLGRADFESRSIGSVTLPIPAGISDQNLLSGVLNQCPLLILLKQILH